MDKNLTEDQVRTILQNAPKGTDPNKIVNGLVSRGYILQGLNDKPTTTETPKSNATFQATGNEGVISGTAKSIGNVPSSAINLGKNVVDAISHPVDTTTNVLETLVGTGEKLGRTVGLGKDTPLSQREQQVNQVMDFVKNRYGSTDALKKTLIEDPVGALADFASVLSGAGAGFKVAGLAKVGNVLSNTSKVVEPINALTKAKNVISESTVGRIASDISPTSYKMQQGQVVKALELTPGDLSTIQKSTGNDVTRFIVDKNLIKNTPEETAHALNDLRQTTMQEVRGEVGRVKNVYSSVDVPYVKNGLNVILQGVDKIPGLEDVAGEIKSLANKDTYTLNDIQRAKELLDENSNIYSKVGDVKTTSQAKGLSNIRDNMKTFIEDEVSKNTNGKTKIKQLNNDVQTSYAVEEAITNRAMKGMSRQYLNAFDLALGMGGAYFNPLIGAGVVIAKKVAQSPAFRLKVAKLLSKQPVQFVKNFAKEMANNNLSESTLSKLQSIVDEAKTSVPFVESISNVQPEMQVK